jgi:hypothetical protein
MERLSDIIDLSLDLICTEGKSVKSAEDDIQRLPHQLCLVIFCEDYFAINLVIMNVETK